MTDFTYKEAGVDLDVARMVKRRISEIAVASHGPEVLSDSNSFGSLYQLDGYKNPVLVSSTDGVGTKLKIATMLGQFNHIGADLVNACVNDVVVTGARPLIFLDYIAMPKLDAGIVESLISGMTQACSESGCALVGGETAQMPGMYHEGDVELVGFAVGVVDKNDILDPAEVNCGDVLIGIPSNGLHTNGYSLVRKVFALDEDQEPLRELYPPLDQSLGETLLEPHPSYYRAISPAFDLIKAIAHITGGGLIENVPRILSPGLAAEFDTTSWVVPPIFHLIQEKGRITREEMYRVFNMGLGIVMACDPDFVKAVLSVVPESKVVGQVIQTTGERKVIL